MNTFEPGFFDGVIQILYTVQLQSYCHKPDDSLAE